MRDIVDIGMGKTARRGYHLDDIALVPSRRTRGSRDVSIAWQIDAHQFDLPLVAAPSDAVVSPGTAREIDRLGGLAVLNGEGLWARYEDPEPVLDLIRAESDPENLMRRLYSEPVKPELVAQHIDDLNRSGARVAVRLSPQKTPEYAKPVLDAGVDILVIQGTVVSAEHVAVGREPLNLKTFIADLDIPVIVGGCADYQTALHLMRTGAAGIIVGYGSRWFSTTDSVLGISVPMATALADAAAARRDYLDETGGRYVHIVANGVDLAGDIAKAVACGADAVMLGPLLAAASEAPGQGRYWDATVSHPKLPRSGVDAVPGSAAGPVSLEEVLLGPTSDPSGYRNVFGALRRSMAKCGYSNVKEFQKVGVTTLS